jgi:uncharacterized protein (TIGR02646 family)
MRRINKGSPPNSFVTYCKRAGARYDSIDTDVKRDLLISLLDEQGWICGYCQQKIASEKRAKIEHHCEQAICDGTVQSPDRRLDYTNLMAVCLGQDGFSVLTCDSNKARFDINSGLPINISPWIQAHMNGIRYASSGAISSAITHHVNELDQILNLNTERLKELRKDKFFSIWKNSRHENRSTQKEKMRRLLEKNLERNGSKFTNDFPGLSEYMLAKYC